MNDKNASKPVELPERATPLQPAEPTEVPAIMGSTFAERAAASKALHAQDAEDKSVSSAQSKSRRRS